MRENSAGDRDVDYQGWLSWLVAVLFILALILTSVRLLLTPVFVQLEYRTPNFPPDPYGFTQQDRLYWSSIALDYLLNDQDISFLGDLRFEDGTRVYNERELKHMQDVKEVVHSVLIVWYLSLGAYKTGLARGGWITVGIVAVTMVAVLIAFGVFFVFFHQIFFESGTWVFRFSDTLIRLFPQRFWRDAFIAIGLLSLAGGLALGFGFRSRTSSPG
jgi:integral membrane protein (TIGR01906 family)